MSDEFTSTESTYVPMDEDRTHPAQTDKPNSREGSVERSPKLDSSRRPSATSVHGEPPRKPANAPVPEPTNVVGVFGLSIRTVERDLQAEFEKSGKVDKVTVVYDQRTERSRGFGFVTMASIEDAERAIADLNGIELHGRRLRVDFSATTRPHDPTPGHYKGPSRYDDLGPRRDYGGGGGGGRRGGDDRWAVRDDRWAPRGGRDDRRGGYSDRYDRGGDRYGGGGRDSYRDDRRDDRYAPYGGRDSRRDRDDSYDRPIRRSRSRSPPPPARSSRDYDRDERRERSISPPRRRGSDDRSRW